MRIYISGAITGTDDYMERFFAAEEKLTLQGHSVVNPAKVNLMMPEDMEWSEYMTMSFAMLTLCRAIYMLKGWESSTGANLEYNYAKENNYLIIFEK